MTLQNPFKRVNPYYIPDNHFKNVESYVDSFYKKNKWNDCQHCQKISNQKGSKDKQNVYNHQLNLSRKQFRFPNQNNKLNPFFKKNLIQFINAKKQNIQFNRKDEEFLRKLKEANPFKNKSLDKNQPQYYSNSMFPSFAGYSSNKKQYKCNSTNKTIPESYQKSLQKIPFKNKLQICETVESLKRNSIQLNKQKEHFQSSNTNKLRAKQKTYNLQQFGQQEDPKQIIIKGKIFYLNKVQRFKVV